MIGLQIKFGPRHRIWHGSSPHLSFYQSASLKVTLETDPFYKNLIGLGSVFNIRLVLCPVKKFGDRKFALWLCPRIFPMCYQYQTAGGLTQYLDRAESADVFTHTVYE